MRQEPRPTDDGLRHRLSEHGGRRLRGSTALLTRVLDRIVDGYFEVTEDVEDAHRGLDEQGVRAA